MLSLINIKDSVVKIIKYIFSLIQDDKGNLSAMRVVWIFSVIIFFITWAVISIQNGHIEHFGAADSTMISVLFGAKVGQKWIENSTDTKKDDSESGG